jgi:cyanate permease
VGSVFIDRFGWRALFIFTGLGSCLWLLPWFHSAPREAPVNVNTSPAPRAPVSWGQVFRLRPAWAITIGAFFYSYYWYFCLTWLPSYLIMSRHFSYLKMGTFTTLPFAVLSVVSPLSGWSADKLIAHGGSPLAVRKVFVCLGFLLGSSICLVPQVKSANVVLLTLVCSLGGIGLASANYWALTETITPESMIGRVIGYQNTIANLAGVLAPIVTGWLVGKTRNFGLAILLSAGALWIAAAAYGFLLWRNDLDLARPHFPGTLHFDHHAPKG